MILYIKAKIFQYTGLYLAEREEKEYMRSAKAEIRRQKLLYAKHDIDLLNELIAGLWHCEHGFVRPISFDWEFSTNPLKVKFAFLHRSYLQLKFDVEKACLLLTNVFK